MNSTSHTDAAEIILKLLAEGGSLTLLGIKAANGWRFRLVRDESTLADLLSEEDRQGVEFVSKSDWVDSWQDALQMLDKYRWHQLHPSQVHPDFRREIWAAVQSRSSRKSARGPFWRRLVSYFAGRQALDGCRRRQFDRWRRVCRGEPPYPNRLTIALPLR